LVDHERVLLLLRPLTSLHLPWGHLLPLLPLLLLLLSLKLPLPLLMHPEPDGPRSVRLENEPWEHLP
jgi:hypothetical protein